MLIVVVEGMRYRFDVVMRVEACGCLRRVSKVSVCCVLEETGSCASA